MFSFFCLRNPKLRPRPKGFQSSFLLLLCIFYCYLCHHSTLIPCLFALTALLSGDRAISGSVSAVCELGREMIAAMRVWRARHTQEGRAFRLALYQIKSDGLPPRIWKPQRLRGPKGSRVLCHKIFQIFGSRNPFQALCCSQMGESRRINESMSVVFDSPGQHVFFWKNVGFKCFFESFFLYQFQISAWKCFPDFGPDLPIKPNIWTFLPCLFLFLSNQWNCIFLEFWVPKLEGKNPEHSWTFLAHQKPKNA